MPTPDQISPAFLALAVFTLVAAVSAVALRNLVHCALCAALSFAGIAMLFLHLDAQFAGLAQLLIYVGAIAILVIFAILLTRSADAPNGSAVFGRSWLWGLLVAGGVLAVMLSVVLASPSLVRPPPGPPTVTVKGLGKALMSTYVLPLEILGLLLTAALIGAAVLAMQEKPKK
jgi:NADH-quinone oxidoreductase subunit J